MSKIVFGTGIQSAIMFGFPAVIMWLKGVEYWAVAQAGMFFCHWFFSCLAACQDEDQKQ